MKTNLLLFTVALAMVLGVQAADVVPKTITADSTTYVIVWPTNFFAANSNLINAAADTTSVIPIIRGGSGASTAAGARLAWGLDSASPGSTGTNILVSATPGAVRVILGLDEGAPGAFGTNVLTIATAAEARALLGLNPGAPGAMGTNLLTAVSASAARTLLDVVARDGGASTNQQALNPTLSFQIGLGSLQFSDSVGDAQTILSNQLNAASTAWPVLFDYTGVAATNMAPRDQDVLNLATGKRAFVVLANGYATNLSQVVSGKSSVEDFTLLGAAGTNYFGFGYVNDGAKMGPKLRQTGGTAAIVESVADDDILNFGSAARQMPVSVVSVEALGSYDRQAVAALVTGGDEAGTFVLDTNAVTGLHLAPAYVTAVGTHGGGIHKMRMVSGMVVAPRSRNNGTGYSNGAATITCGTNNVPCTITTSSGSISSFTVGYDALSTTTPWIHAELDVVQGGGSNGKAMCFEWAPADYTLDSFDVTAAGTGYSDGAATVTAFGETFNVTLTTSGGAITAVAPTAGDKCHIGDQTTSFAVVQGGGSAGTVTFNVSEYVRYVSGGTYTTQARWKPRSIINGALQYVDITTAGSYSELPGSAHATYGRWSRDCTTAEYWPYASAPTFRAWVPGLGGTLVPFAGGSGFWTRVTDRVVTPQMFGAVVNGSTSDSWPIQAAAYAAASEQSALYFPPTADVGLGGYPSPAAGYLASPSDYSVPRIDARNIKKIDMAGYIFGISSSWTNSVLLVGSGTNQTHDKYDLNLWVVSSAAPTDKKSAAVEVNTMTYSKMRLTAVGWGTGLLFRPLGYTISKHNDIEVGFFVNTACNVRSDTRGIAVDGTSETDEWVFHGGQWGLANPYYVGADIDWSQEKTVCNLDASEGYMSEWSFYDIMFTGAGPILYQGDDVTRLAKNLWMRNCKIDGKWFVASQPFTRSYTAPVNCWFANWMIMSRTNALVDSITPLIDYRTAIQPAIIWNGHAGLNRGPAIFWPSYKTFGMTWDADAGSSVVDPMLDQRVHKFGVPVKSAAGYVAFPGAKVWDMDALTEAASGDFPDMNIQGNEIWWTTKNSATTAGKMVDKMWGVEVTPRNTNCIVRVGNMNIGQVFVQAFNSAGTILTDPKDVFGAYTFTNTTAGGKYYYTMVAGGSDIFLSTNVAKAWIGFGRDFNRILYTNLVQQSPTIRIVAGAGAIRGGDLYPALPASPDGAIAPVGTIVRDGTYRNKLYHCGEIITTTLTNPITNAVAETTLTVGSTTGMAAGDVLEITSSHIPNWDSSGYDKMLAFPLVVNTTISAVAGPTTLTVSFTPKYSCAAGAKVRAQSRTISGVHTAAFSQAAPANLQAVQDPCPWFPVESTSYPNGITILAMRVKTTTSTTYSVILKEYTSPTDGSPVSVETVATSSSYEAESTSIDNPTIEAGNILYIDLPTTDIAHVTVEIDYVAN